MKQTQSFVLTISILFTLAFIVACGGNTATSVPAATRAPVQATNAPAPSNIVTATPENSDAAPAATFAKINLNTATAQEILTIPNTGNRMVREFQEYRPYTSILQFRQEIGKYVDTATVAAYEKYVYVPINVNQADAATLQQIPNLTAETVAQLIVARPYADNSAFLAKLTALTNGANSATAQNYLAQ